MISKDFFISIFRGVFSFCRSLNFRYTVGEGRNGSWDEEISVSLWGTDTKSIISFEISFKFQKAGNVDNSPPFPRCSLISMFYARSARPSLHRLLSLSVVFALFSLIITSILIVLMSRYSLFFTVFPETYARHFRVFIVLITLIYSNSFPFLSFSVSVPRWR